MLHKRGIKMRAFIAGFGWGITIEIVGFTVVTWQYWVLLMGGIVFAIIWKDWVK